ncbi:MAG TPA: hypothetical protein VKP30_33170, partial [Polyangiaceae bacterium]|nr:hypothetical protein [Polyangiaceae bacterium]
KGARPQAQLGICRILHAGDFRTGTYGPSRPTPTSTGARRVVALGPASALTDRPLLRPAARAAHSAARLLDPPTVPRARKLGQPSRQRR